MKEVAILLLLALMLNGCGDTTSVIPGGGWRHLVRGADRWRWEASGFSFVAQFT